MDTILPESAEEVAAAVEAAARDTRPLEVLGLGSKRGLGRSSNLAHCLDLSKLSGITLYEPEELVLTAGAGTPLADIEKAVAKKKQILAFEPPDLGALLGGPPGRGSIGGVLACNLAGPRRIKSGAARDHFLGVTAVSGRTEIFKAGGRVMNLLVAAKKVIAWDDKYPLYTVNGRAVLTPLREAIAQEEKE